jgi:HK97 family phage portal protein
MSLLSRLRRAPERRASIEDPRVKVSSEGLLSFLGLGGAATSATGEAVTIDAALGVPAMWAAVNFLSRTIAALPLHVYRRGATGRERVRGGVADILGFAANEETTSFDWRKLEFDRVFTSGRSLTFIERAPGGDVLNLWPLDPARTRVERGADGRKRYRLKAAVYEAGEVIDIPFMLKGDGLGSRSPIFSNREDIGLMIAATRYAARWFQGGGVPPLVMTGAFVSGAGLRRATEDLSRAVEEAARDGRPAIAIPDGHTLSPIGLDPEKSQLTALQRFGIEQVARIYGLPPVFVQDLTHGTFSNTEQQDLHLAKHVVRLWAKQAEDQINLKVFGRGSDLFAEFNLDGLMRGDFTARMSGYATAIQNGLLTPNEGRAMENRPDRDGGDALLVQGATVPLAAQVTAAPAPQVSPPQAPKETPNGA